MSKIQLFEPGNPTGIWSDNQACKTYAQYYRKTESWITCMDNKTLSFDQSDRLFKYVFFFKIYIL